MSEADTTWDHHTDRRIKQLHPFIQRDAIKFINECEKAYNITLRVTSGRRTFAEQDELYAQGRTTSGRKVTNAQAGESYHNYGLAIDVVEIRDGQAIWETENWGYIGEMGEMCGFEWGGRWQHFTDRPHFQKTFGYSTAELKALSDQGLLAVA